MSSLDNYKNILIIIKRKQIGTFRDKNKRKNVRSGKGQKKVRKGRYKIGNWE